MDDSDAATPARLLLKQANEVWDRDGVDAAEPLLAQAHRLAPDDAKVADGYLFALYLQDRFRDALALLSGMPESVRQDDDVRDSARRIYSELGWHAHALHETRGHPGFRWPRRYLNIWWLRTWLRTGGLLAMVRRRMGDRERHIREVWNRQSTSLDVVDKLDIADDAVRASVRTDLDDCGRKWAAAVIRYNATSGRRHDARIAVALAGQGAAMWLVTSDRWGPMPAVVVTCALIGYTLAAGQNYVLNSQTTLRASRIAEWSPWLITVITGVGAWLTGAYTPGTGFRVWPDGFYLTGFGYAVHWLIRRVLHQIDTRLITLRINRIWEGDPRSAIIDSLVRLMQEIPDPKRRSDLISKARWVSELEWVASRIEKDLPGRLVDGGDGETRQWARDRGAGVARAVRNYKRRIIAATEPGWRSLETDLHTFTSRFASGDFGALPWKPAPSRPEQPRSRRRVALDVARTIVVTAAPLSGVLLLQPFLGLDAPMLAWAKVIGVAWAVLYLLLTLDPSIRDKIDVLSPLVGTAREDLRSREAPSRERHAER
ncbi:tetratricopeptide repeat protein [Nonomuraea rubra]